MLLKAVCLLFLSLSGCWPSFTSLLLSFFFFFFYIKKRVTAFKRLLSLHTASLYLCSSVHLPFAFSNRLFFFFFCQGLCECLDVLSLASSDILKCLYRCLCSVWTIGNTSIHRSSTLLLQTKRTCSSMVNASKLLTHSSLCSKLYHGVLGETGLVWFFLCVCVS